jgi:hypothetical protein
MNFHISSGRGLVNQTLRGWLLSTVAARQKRRSVLGDQNTTSRQTTNAIKTEKYNPSPPLALAFKADENQKHNRNAVRSNSGGAF